MPFNVCIETVAMPPKSVRLVIDDNKVPLNVLFYGLERLSIAHGTQCTGHWTSGLLSFTLRLILF